MDATKVLIYLGIAAILLIATPVAAQEPDDLHRSSPGVVIMQMPAPIPDLAGSSSGNIPDLNLPPVSRGSWPSSVPAQEGVRSDVGGYVEGVNNVLNDNYEFILGRIYQARTVTNQARAVIGESSGDSGDMMFAAAGEGPLSATSIATDLAAAIRWSMAYLRGLSNLGPLGLDLTFIFVALGWIVLVNVSEMGVRLVAWLLRTIIGVITWVFNTVIGFVLGIINIILKIVDIILPL
jgi:hypothetical protein